MSVFTLHCAAPAQRLAKSFIAQANLPSSMEKSCSVTTAVVVAVAAVDIVVAVVVAVADGVVVVVAAPFSLPVLCCCGRCSCFLSGC